MSLEQNGSSTDRNTDLYEMHNLAKSEEALINRLDTNHKGYVTPEQLRAAASNNSLTESERHTAEIMIRTQDDLRYQRLGYLPETSIKEHGELLQDATGRPFPKNSSNPATDKLPIYLEDVKKFDASLDREAMVRKDMDPIHWNLSEDMMRKYSKDGRKLTPTDVWGAVETLSHKKNLTFVEKEELETLKFTQNQMRQMWPKEPKDHFSPEYKTYLRKLDQVSIGRSDLDANTQWVTSKEVHNPAIGNTYDALHPGHGGRAEASAGGGQPTAPGEPPSAGPTDGRPADARPADAADGKPPMTGSGGGPALEMHREAPSKRPPRDITPPSALRAATARSLGG